MKQKDYLLDTNLIRYVHELEAGSQSEECLTLKKRLESLPQNARIFLSPITTGEVEYGIRVGPFDDPDNEKYKAELNSEVFNFIYSNETYALFGIKNW